MKLLTFLLLPAILTAQARYARLGEFQGKVDVQLQAPDPWIAAERNLPLPQSSWLRTSADSRLEIELDEGSVFRLGPDSQSDLSDYTRLSTGQRITVHAAHIVTFTITTRSKFAWSDVQLYVRVGGRTLRGEPCGKARLRCLA